MGQSETKASLLSGMKDNLKRDRDIIGSRKQEIYGRIRCHVIRFYKQFANSLLPYYKQYAKSSEEYRQEIKYRIQKSKQFCLRDKETRIAITAWYICFHELLQYLDQLEADNKDIEDRQQRLKLQKDNIEKVVNCWIKLYPLRLEEQREAEQRQKETIFAKCRRTLSLFQKTDHNTKNL